MNNITDISTLGEFGLIKHITKDFDVKNKSTIKAVGDDAAVLNFTDKEIVVTTDLLIENIHFDLTYVPLKHLGYKSVIVNLSDVYAMNAQARQITVSIAISSRFPVEAVDELYKGIKLACDTYGVDLIGGDTTSSKTGLMISVTAIGEIEKGKAVYRNTAKSRELICVSGDLGAAYAGLQVLEREKQVFKDNPEIQPELDKYGYVLERQLKPEARADIVRLLAELKITPTSMIDISDGLSSEILHICDQSNVGCKIFEEKIPIANETRNFSDELMIDATTFAMNGGEDYELLFTISQKDFEKLDGNPDISIIGHLTEKEEGNFLIAKDGTPVKIQAQGWTHQ